MVDRISSLVSARGDDIVATRRYLHARPETGFQENETAAYIGNRLRKTGLEVREGIGTTGIIARLRGGKPGRTLAIRADIDGLPINELTGLEFASTNGSMHACGHDGHITMALTAAEILASISDEIAGDVVFIFQPSEELSNGAIAMIEDGAMEIAKADAVIGTHLWNQTPTGFVGVNQSTVFAGADLFEISVKGHGGHGAMPHLTVDPVVAAANIINAAQTVVAREISPQEMGVVTFGSIHGGSAGNVIAGEVRLNGTIRAYNAKTHRTIADAVSRITTNVAESLRATATYTRLAGTPPVINNPDVANWVTSMAMQTIGEESVGELEPISVGDDMAEFLNRIPGTYFILGASKEGTEGHHNAKFDYDEACLPIGTEIFVRAALDIGGMP
ncbi:MAG: amidohydrolase [Chloroflexi bacterium]|nr:amidohydrolase [Chloroflexota bacterium]